MFLHELNSRVRNKRKHNE